MHPDTTDTTSQSTDSLLFDDLRIDSILHDAPGEPSSADLFAANAEERAAIACAWHAGQTTEALRQTRALLANGGVLTEQETSTILARIGRLVPDCAWPSLPADAFPYETILQPLFDRASRGGRIESAGAVGLVLARAQEGRGRFAASAGVFAPLLTYARLRNSRVAIAQNANNLGYARSMQGRWHEAEGLCAEAVDCFTAVDAESRANNARANLLTARFALLGRMDALELEPKIQAVDDFYAAASDWRRRKTLVLLARIREQAGELGEALKLMDQSLRLTCAVPTRHREVDAGYRAQLEVALNREEKRSLARGADVFHNPE